MYDSPAGLITSSMILWLMTVVCVSIRLGGRIRERQNFLASDWLILSAWCFGTGLTILEIYGVGTQSLGYRIDATLIDPASITRQLNKAKHLVFLLVGITALGFIKLSVCFLYWHLFAQVILRRFLIIWMVIIVTWATAFIMAGFLECGSHLKAALGSATEYAEHCSSAVPGGYAMVGTDIATDFITLIIPIPVVWGLQMDVRTKLLTLMAFLIGALSVGASIAKGYIYIRSSMGLSSEDGLLILTGVSIWNLVEVEIGIIAACGPLLWPILSRAFSYLTSLIFSRRRFLSKISNSNESHELPRFVKMPESEVQLPIGFRTVSRTPSERGSADLYRLPSTWGIGR